MLIVLSHDGNKHSFRHISLAFKEVLKLWQRVSPTDRLFCQQHGKFEEVGIFDPSTMREVRDHLEEVRNACEAIEKDEREKFLAKLERDRRKR